MAGPRRSDAGALAIIGLVVAAGAAAFAYTAGWFSPHRLTPERMVDALSRRGGNPVGHRRNHSKGICFTGEFVANGAGAPLDSSDARDRTLSGDRALRDRNRQPRCA